MLNMFRVKKKNYQEFKRREGVTWEAQAVWFAEITLDTRLKCVCNA